MKFLWLTVSIVFVASSAFSKDVRDFDIGEKCQNFDDVACAKLILKCRKKDSGACYIAGMSYGLRGQVQEGKDLVAKACDLGEKIACKTYGQMEANQTESKRLDRRRQELEKELAVEKSKQDQTNYDHQNRRIDPMAAWNAGPGAPMRNVTTGRTSKNCTSRPVTNAFGEVLSYNVECD